MANTSNMSNLSRFLIRPAGSLSKLFFLMLLLSSAGVKAQSINPNVPGKISFAEYPQNLGNAGRVIAHENGPFNFLPIYYCYSINTCPKQLEEMKKANVSRPVSQQIHFVKLSIRTLRDGTWVVAHDQYQEIVISSNNALPATLSQQGIHLSDQIPTGKKLWLVTRNNGQIQPVIYNDIPELNQVLISSKANMLDALPAGYSLATIDLSAIDSAQFLQLKAQYGDLFSVYRLDSYAPVSWGNYFNYMLNFKTDPNQNIIIDIDRLNLNDRVVLEPRTNADAEWVHNHQGSKSGIFFMGRVSTPQELDALFQRAPSYGRHMWAIEVEPKTVYTNDLIKRINTTPYVSHVDSMPYGVGKEIFATACPVALVEINSNITMTSRPMDCLDKVMK